VFRLRRTALLLGVLVLVMALEMASATAQGPDNRAALYVVYGDGRVTTQCIHFDQPSITGEELLTLAALDAIVDISSGQGGAVCSINGSGCNWPRQACFCQCMGDPCRYWAYYHRINGQWEYSSVGASLYTVTDGALEAWSWGPGNFVTGTEPPAVTFDQICNNTSAPTSTATPTATASATMQRQDSAPDGTFVAEQSTLTAGGCTVLKWAIFNATQVTLNGTGVVAQDRKEVCPTGTERYTLTAANGYGTFSREIIVNISTPAVATAAMGTRTLQQTPVSTQSANASQPTATTPGVGGPASLADATASQSAPTSAITTELTVEPTVQRVTATPDVLAGLLASRPTPVAIATAEARRQLGAGNLPTPTPILLAQAVLRQSSDAAGREAGAGTSSSAKGAGNYDRTFRHGLLPGYAAFLFMAAILLLASAWAARRRRAASATETGK
jgi:hypothetical protein